MDRDTPITGLKGVGEKTQKLFEKLDIRTVGDLVDTYPRDYDAFREPEKIRQAAPGEVCAIHGVVRCITGEKRVGNLYILSVDAGDETGTLRLTFYNMPFLKKTLRRGGFYIFRGRVSGSGEGCFLRMEQPKIYSMEEYSRLAGHLVPLYSLTKGLTNQATQKCVRQALAGYVFEEEYYSQEFLRENQLLSRREALETIHFPTTTQDLTQARKRIVFDEFFFFLLRLRRNREEDGQLPNRYRAADGAPADRFLEQLPFPLTGAQARAWKEIREDLAGTWCMNRLVQGDVGSGKTILALLALLTVAAAGYQGALMAPTEVLAAQHFETVRDYVEKYGLAFRPVLLTGSMSAREKRRAREEIESGEANLVIGTHALIQEAVCYRALALVVTDEQHRFGVRQREHLAEKGDSPHVLVMSATPIPRTLAIILYGDLSISVVDELPASRLPIKNCVVGTAYRPKAYKFIAGEVAGGRQAYVICPQVEGDPEDGPEMASMENVMDYSEKLREALPGIRVASLHGKMRPGDKNKIMEDFAARSIDVLVSTTVVEVGINVPNATVMMVENAERFGLAQLHQLRGRVGRGAHQSYCIFVSTSEKTEVMERLKILNKSNDGFFIASEDLRLRGPGELTGVRQSGELSFQVGDIYADAAVLRQASQAAEELLRKDPHLELPQNSAIRGYLEEEGRCTGIRSI